RGACAIWERVIGQVIQNRRRVGGDDELAGAAHDISYEQHRKVEAAFVFQLIESFCEWPKMLGELDKISHFCLRNSESKSACFESPVSIVCSQTRVDVDPTISTVKRIGVCV